MELGEDGVRGACIMTFVRSDTWLITTTLVSDLRI